MHSSSFSMKKSLKRCRSCNRQHQTLSGEAHRRTCAQRDQKLLWIKGVAMMPVQAPGRKLCSDHTGLGRCNPAATGGCLTCFRVSMKDISACVKLLFSCRHAQEGSAPRKTSADVIEL